MKDDYSSYVRFQKKIMMKDLNFSKIRPGPDAIPIKYSQSCSSLKLNAYGFSKNAFLFFYSYLKRRKQSAKLNNVESVSQMLITGVPQGSILGPILSNIIINDLVFIHKKRKTFKPSQMITLCLQLKTDLRTTLRNFRKRVNGSSQMV